MIGRLHGVLLEKQPPQLLLDVGGVGYEISAPMTTFYELPETGNEITLHTHLAVREDAHVLYGFLREQDRLLFRTLIKVSGVGPKLALAILSGMSADEFAGCVQNGDSALLTRLPGVGKKTAERLVVELKDRLKDWQGTTLSADISTNRAPASDALKDAISALVSLGYKPQEASRMVSQLESDGLASEELIRLALKAAAQ
ncbi:MAG: Holliday junction branch migration protein RuvA [Gammaproteobacteria bacterium]|nr:Holliday junction branch migration protein RuvA [Gammaproteobacteria bacterium]MCF6259494.1 Holliday junction branch migration protein RuvA [Gammaproteobacteria bacterium]